MSPTQDISRMTKSESDEIFNVSYKKLIDKLHIDKIPNRTTDKTCNTLANRLNSIDIKKLKFYLFISCILIFVL
jgi:hypothetical protein